MTLPASFLLVAAMSPCPCGYRGDTKRPCKCSPMQIDRYMGRISGPLLDRIDLHIEVPAVPFQELSASADGTPSTTMREQVHRARLVQRQHLGADGHRLNARMTSQKMHRYCALDDEGRGLLKNAMGRSAYRHGPMTASSVSRGPSPTWKGWPTAGPATSAKRSATGSSTASCGRSELNEAARIPLGFSP